MERDEHGREVRRRPRPGRRDPELDDDAWPVLQHSPLTYEGRFEALGVFSRGMARRRNRPPGRHGPTVRVAGIIVAVAMLLPIVVGTVSVLWTTFVD